MLAAPGGLDDCLATAATVVEIAAVADYDNTNDDNVDDD